MPPDPALAPGLASTAPRKAALALVLVVAAVYGQTIGFGWLTWDDPIHVADNAAIVPGNWSGLAGLWREPYRKLYIPVSYMLFAAEAAVTRLWDEGWPPDPRLFHAVSVGLHACCTLLVFRIVRRLVGGVAAPAVGAAVFALHPLQAESVAWISEQRGLLASVLALAAIDLVVTACRASAAHPWRDGRNWAAGLLLGLAVLAKPSAVTAPLTLVCILHWMLGRSWRAAAAAAVPLAIPAAVAALVTRSLQGMEPSVASVPVWLRPVVAGDALAFYARAVVFPFGLSMDHGRTPAEAVADPWAWLAATIAWTAVAAAALPALRPWRCAIAAFVIPLVPVLGIVPFTFQEFSTVADRYGYLSMLGPALAVAAACRGLGRRGRMAVALGLVVLATISCRQVTTWRGPQSVYGHAIRVNPRSVHARMNLGLVLLDEGRLEAASGLLAEAARLAPAYAKARYNLALARHAQKMPAEAEAEYRAAVGLDPGHADAHNNLGILLCQQGRVDEGVMHFRAAIRLRPGFDAARRNLEQAERSRRP